MLPDMSSGRAGAPACMNCRAAFYAAIINTAAYPNLAGLLGVPGQRARAE